MEDSPEQLPTIENPKPNKGFWHYLNVSEEITGKIGKIGGFLLILIPVVLYFTKDKKNQAVKDAESGIIEIKDCLTDDKIKGTIVLNGDVIKGGFIELKVHNKFTQDNDIKANKVTLQDGTFEFEFCKATTEFVEFDTRLFDRKDHFINKYKVDVIPDTIILTPQNQ